MNAMPGHACGGSGLRVRCADGTRVAEPPYACGGNGRVLFRLLTAGKGGWKRYLKCKHFAICVQDSRLRISVPFFGAIRPPGRKQAILSRAETQSVSQSLIAILTLGFSILISIFAKNYTLSDTMKTLIISLLVTLLLLTASPLAQGQDARLYDKDQIGSHTVLAFCQDQRDFLWMGTENGLCRFDGTQYTT